jgi:hypothetical protein
MYKIYKSAVGAEMDASKTGVAQELLSETAMWNYNEEASGFFLVSLFPGIPLDAAAGVRSVWSLTVAIL